jgi:NodT family efflux transporter outer membrane factor (OMF) lipoprotein
MYRKIRDYSLKMKNVRMIVLSPLSRKRTYQSLIYLSIVAIITSCGVPAIVEKEANTITPDTYQKDADTVNIAVIKWKEYFTDPYLTTLIDSALHNNQELNITLQEVEIARNEARVTKGEFLPSIGLKAGGEVEKVGRYTSQGANDANTEIRPGQEFPEPLPDYMVGLQANWEVDIWKKLRNANKAAVTRFLATVDGKNFMQTNLIAEIANSYYELLALDNQINIVNQNVDLKVDALRIVKVQKEAARVTELAVRKFEAELFNTLSLQYDLQQQVVEVENKINFLVGRYPQAVVRDSKSFNDLVPQDAKSGLPSQLLQNRPDVRQAELQLAASNLDVKVARARFYPSLGINAQIGFQAFDPSLLLKTPQSLLYTLAGDLTAPLVNRNAIKAMYLTANAQQIQAAYNYEQTLLNAYVEVANQLSKASNLQKSYDLKAQEVDALTQSIEISTILFKSARADYMEVLLTQRDALESRMELVETKKKQMSAMVNVYRSLGGGWN